MIKKKLTKIGITTLALSMALLTGCGKDKDKKEVATSSDAVLNMEASDSMNNPSNIDFVPTKEGYVLSELTGEWIDEKLENQRPMCIMINNIIDAMPQSGISQADITYEMIVEGGITRYMCVFKDYDNIEKLGPVRSSRLYYVQASHIHGDLYAHYGWNTFAEEKINQLEVNNINGIDGVGGVTYYRDDSRYAPHNVYTNGEMLNAGVEYMGYSKEYKDNFKKSLAFYYEDTELEGGVTANKATAPFSSYYSPWFEYNPETKLYERFQYGEAQIDQETGQQLAYKNVLAIYARYSPIHDILLQVHWDEGGNGYYISNGKAVPITWRYEEGVIKYYDQSGAQLKMNPGKTFIEVLDSDGSSDMVFE